MPYLVEQARSRLELDKLDAWQTVGSDNGKGAIDDLPLWSVE